MPYLLLRYQVHLPNRCAFLGSAVQVGPAEYTVELSATSDQLAIPALWQLPTMAVAMPAMTMLGGLAAVHWLRARARGPEALASGGS